MVNYAATHARALRQVTARGTDTVFTTTDAGGYNDQGGWDDNPTAAIPGKAVELPGDPEEYEAMELIGKGAITLFFVPTTFGQLPGLGHTAAWAGKTRTVRQVYPIRPAGVAVAARVVLA